MYHVTAAQKAHITQMVRSLVSDAEAFYGREFDMPSVTFDANGHKAAGMAYHHEWRVNFHAGYVQHFFDEYIQETIAHEVAHLITGKMYPDTIGERYRSGGRIVTVRKGRPHGSEWKEVMRRIFKIEPSRCHNWQLPGVVRRRSSAPNPMYHCTGCNREMPIGPKRHKKTRNGVSAYTHCGGGKLVLVSEEMIAMPVAAQTPAPAPKPTGKGTKAERAQVLIRSMQRQGQPRKDIIEVMMRELEMGKPGASTYYQKYK